MRAVAGVGAGLAGLAAVVCCAFPALATGIVAGIGSAGVFGVAAGVAVGCGVAAFALGRRRRIRHAPPARNTPTPVGRR